MENEYSKHLIYGNFLSMPEQDFPIDCETLAALQNNTQKLAVIASVAGCDRLILCGCEASGTSRSAGYVFIRSTENPVTGEILYHPAQTAASEYCRIVEDPIDVTANTIEYPGAYTQRYLKSENGSGAMLWTSFKTLDEMSLSALMTAIENEAAERETAIQQAMSAPAVKFVRGMIMMWSGNSSDTIPEGWAMCDGSIYTIGDETVMTPDLRDRFILGAKGVNGVGNTEQYNTGARGGALTHTASFTLTPSNLPNHRHAYISDSHSEDAGAEEPYYLSDRDTGQYSAQGTGNGTKFLTESRIYDKEGKPIATSLHDDTKTVTSTVNTMPPYYALAYIMKL